jgi:hypothetical protein
MIEERTSQKRWLTGKEYQSRRIKNEVNAHSAATSRRREENEIMREFGYETALVTQVKEAAREQEIDQIQAFIDNNKQDAKKFQELPYANGWRVTSSLNQ